MKRKIITALLSAVIALALWAYVITFVSAEREETFYDIDVSMQGEALLEDRGLMITSTDTPTVTLTLYGKRSELNKLSSENITIVADLSKIGGPGVHTLNYTPYYPGDIPSNAFTVQSQYPGMVRIVVENKITKNVPVVVNYTGSIPADYRVDKENIELDYTEVTISGPESVIEKITQAQITVDLNARTASFSESYRVTLCDSEGKPVDAGMVEASLSQVYMTLYIQRVKAVPLVVTVTAGGGATEQTSKITITPATIKVAGNETALEKLTEIDLGTIDLANLLTDTELTYRIRISDNLENLSGVTHATVKVEFPDLMTRQFTVNTITPRNVPEGMECEIITQELKITVRGPKELVQKMTLQDISVFVDFADDTPGTFTKKPIIEMGARYTQVGALGNYSVSATLGDPEAES